MNEIIIMIDRFIIFSNNYFTIVIKLILLGFPKYYQSGSICIDGEEQKDYIAMQLL